MSPKVIEHLRATPLGELILYRLRLPRRYPRGHVKNVERVRQMAAGLHQWRVAHLTGRGRARHDPECPMCRVRVRWTW